MKRVFDFVLSSILMILTLPVWVVSVAIIMVADRGPVFFKQKRIGLDQKEFAILKFRTMYSKKGNTCTTTTETDNRVFPGGNFLRKYKIDEIPQIVNVIIGDMSLVGPRPTVYDDVQRMSKAQKRRFDVKPGMTGLAQISGNTSLKWGERIRYDLEYIDRFSVAFDIQIIIRTAFLVASGKAETHPLGNDEWSD